jgi:hypothetical protein
VFVESHTRYVTVQMLLAAGVVKLATPAAVMVAAGVQALTACGTPVTLKVEPAGNLSLVLTLNVPATKGCKVAVLSLTASMTGVSTVLVQFAPAGQLGSPPPVAVAVLLTLCAPVAPAPPAAAATLTGTSMTIGPAAFGAIEQPAKLLVLEQPDSVPPVAVMLAATVVMPAGKVSSSVIAAVVGPFATAIVIR